MCKKTRSVAVLKIDDRRCVYVCEREREAEGESCSCYIYTACSGRFN